MIKFATRICQIGIIQHRKACPLIMEAGVLKIQIGNGCFPMGAHVKRIMLVFRLMEFNLEKLF